MRRRLLTAGLLLALVACKNGVLTTPKSTPHAAASTASTVAATSLSPLPTASTASAALLRPPAGKSSTLEGTVTVDASYMAAVHAATLLSNNGGNVLAVGNSVISNNGSGLISNNGGGLIANNAGNIISDAGGGLVSDAGGGILSDAGSGLLAGGGAGLVANNAGNYGLLQTDTPVFGQEAIAAGMLLQVIDMTTDMAVPLGVDAHAKPVYGVYTNLTGGYKVYLPTSLSTNVRLVATVPGHTDPRTRYSAISQPVSTAALAFDEDTAAVTRLLRQAFRAKFVAMLQTHGINGVLDPAAVAAFFQGSNANPVLVNFFMGILDELFSEIKANSQITAADYPDLAFLLGDVLYAHGGDLTAIDIDPTLYSAGQSAELASNPLRTGKALANMATILHLARQRVTTLGAGKTPGEVAVYFAPKPYLARANAYHARAHPQDPSPYYVIEKGTDLADFLSIEYFSLVPLEAYGCTPDGACSSAAELKSCDFETGCFPVNGVAALSKTEIDGLSRAVATDIGMDPADLDVLAAGAQSVSTALLLQLLDPALKAQLVCIVHNYKQAHPDCVATGTP